IKPGASRAVGLLTLRIQGKAPGLTAISGIAIRIRRWEATGSSGGTSMTGGPVDKRAPAAVATTGAGTGGGVHAVTSGRTAAVLVGGCGCAAGGPGGWAAINPDAPPTLDGGATMSMDLFSSSGTASLNYEWWGEFSE